MSKVKNELEELSFRYLEPAAYEALRAQVDAKRRATEGLIEQLKNTIAAKLREALGAGRRDRRSHQAPVEHSPEAESAAASSSIRCTTSSRCASSPSSVKDCYAALGIIHQTWSPVPGRIKDFIAMPRPNGYQSLHTSVISDRGMPFEVQIRTMEMHRMAEEGIAAHWKYKEGRVGDQKDERYFQWMRQLLEYQQEVRDPQEFIQNLKVDLYPEEVYTFTPKGQVKAFPRGATPIDFAYSIHTDVGHQCVGARVNGKMVPLRAHLRNGDIVEIITSAGHKPSRDWLNFVVTSHARYKIKHLIRLEERTRAIDLGRKVFEKEARRYDVSPKGVQETEAFTKAHAEAGAKTPDDLFALIGYGTLSAKQVLGQLVPADRLREKPPEGMVSAAVRRAFGGGEEKIKVTRLRRCAGVPRAVLQSDSRREDRRLHHARQGRVRAFRDLLRTCVNLLYDPERRIDVEWDKGASGESAVNYTVKLTMEVEDRKGLLAAVSAKIADINTNIKNMEARTGWRRTPRDASM